MNEKRYNSNPRMRTSIFVILSYFGLCFILSPHSYTTVKGSFETCKRECSHGANYYRNWTVEEPNPDYNISLHEKFGVNYTVSRTINVTYETQPGEYRPVKVTRPPNTQPYPFAIAPEPNTYPDFCQQGCVYWFSDSPNLPDCYSRCDHQYRFISANSDVNYSDWAEVARWECRDGCDIAYLRCQPGYYCTDDQMIICPVGRYRDFEYNNVAECNLCPTGRYRDREGARKLEACSQCPQGYYVSTEGSTREGDCDRCPDGTFGPEPGLAICKNITKMSGLNKWRNYQRESVPFIGRW